jgi:UDPglucose 6-dehydrogenase
MANIAVIGTNYVGLVTAACFAELGNQVVGIDIDPGKVERLGRGQLPIYEPGLEEIVVQNLKAGRLKFTLDYTEGLQKAEFAFVCVGTPSGSEGEADTSQVKSAAHSLGQYTPTGQTLIVVNKSTMPIGTGEWMLPALGRASNGSGAAFKVVSNPEFLREGSAVDDFRHPDRVVLGGTDPEAIERVASLYRDLQPEPPIIRTDIPSAEMIKYASNAFLATKISFINEVANICELVGADVTEVAHGIGLDERIGPRFLSAGIGWGGSCFPKDVAALRSIARGYEHETPLLDATVAVNERQRKQVIAKLQRDLHTLKGKRIALLGLSFKPNTDDLREAPSLQMARSLDYLGARAIGYDPVAAKKAAAKRLPYLRKVVFDPYEALSAAHAAVVVTEWGEIRNLDLQRAAALMEKPRVLVDGRNAIDPVSAREAGLLYRGFGRG